MNSRRDRTDSCFRLRELIGGVSVQVGDEVMDASVRGKLAQLAGVLKA